jgi:hypothetical protein
VHELLDTDDGHCEAMAGQGHRVHRPLLGGENAEPQLLVADSLVAQARRAVQRSRAGGCGLQAAAPTALAFRPVHVSDHVADLEGAATRGRPSHAADDQAAAYTGSDPDVEDVVTAGRLGLGQRSQVSVVGPLERQVTEQAPEGLPHVQSGPLRAARPGRDDSVRPDGRRQRDTHRVDPPGLLP